MCNVAHIIVCMLLKSEFHVQHSNAGPLFSMLYILVTVPQRVHYRKYFPRDHGRVQYFPIVHKRKRYFNWFIVTYTDHYFRCYIFQGKHSTLHILGKIKHSLALSSCMASYNKTICDRLPINHPLAAFC